MYFIPLKKPVDAKDLKTVRAVVDAALAMEVKRCKGGVELSEAVLQTAQSLLVYGQHAEGRLVQGSMTWVPHAREQTEAERGRRCLQLLWVGSAAVGGRFAALGTFTAIGLYQAYVGVAAEASAVGVSLCRGAYLSEPRALDRAVAAECARVCEQQPSPPGGAGPGPEALADAAHPPDVSLPSSGGEGGVTSAGAAAAAVVEAAPAAPPPAWHLTYPRPPAGVAAPVPAVGDLDPSYPLPLFARGAVSLDVCLSVREEARAYLRGAGVGGGPRLPRDTTLLLHVLGVPPPPVCGDREAEAHPEEFRSVVRTVEERYAPTLTSAYRNNPIVMSSLTHTVSLLLADRPMSSK